MLHKINIYNEKKNRKMGVENSDNDSDNSERKNNIKEIEKTKL